MNTLTKYLFLLIILSLTNNCFYAQNVKKIDSLNNILSTKDSLSLQTLNELAEIYYYQSDYNLALVNYEKLQKLSNSQNNNKYFVKSLIGLGNIYLDIENYDLAFQYFDKCIHSTRDTLNLAFAYNGYADCFENIGKIDSALYYYNVSLSLFKNLMNYQGIAGVENNIANFYFKNLKYKEAIEHYFNSLNVAKKFNLKKDQCLYLINIGAAYHKLNNNKKAIYYIQQSIEISKEANIKLFLSRAYNELYHIYKSTNNYDLALYYLELHNSISDSIFNNKLQQEIANIKTASEIQKKADEIKLLKKQKELDYTRIQNQWYAMLSLFLFTILIILIFLIIIKNRKNKEEKLKNKLNTEEIKNELQKKEYELLKERSDSKSRELTTITIINTQKKELLLSMKETIEIFEKQRDNTLLKELKQQIDNNIRIENDWEVFKLHFEEVHPDFFKQLKISYPNLTQNNLKLCAYIKIGLSNKEIARLLNVSPDSIKMAKKRLKRKLNISPGDNFSF